MRKIDLEGLLVLQSHPGDEGSEDLGARTVERACRAVGLSGPGELKVEAFGDLTGATFWPALEGFGAPPREVNSWSFAMPAVLAEPVDGAREVNVLPLYDHLTPDGRYDVKVAGLPTVQRHRFRLPTGWPGTVIDGSDEGREAPIFFPSGGLPVVASTVDPDRRVPELSTPVTDGLPNGALDPEAQGSFSDTHQVIRGIQSGIGGGTRTKAQQQAAEEADALALNLDPRHGLGLLAFSGKAFAPAGEWAVSQLAGGQNGTFARPTARANDAYRRGTTLDGYDVTPSRLNTEALWRSQYSFFPNLEGPLAMRGFLPGGVVPSVHDAIVQAAILWTQTGQTDEGIAVGEWRAYTSSAWGDSAYPGDHPQPRPTTGTTGRPPRPVTGGANPPGGFPEPEPAPLPQPLPEPPPRPVPGPRPGGGGAPPPSPDGLPPFQPWGPDHPGWGDSKPPPPPRPGFPEEDGGVIINGQPQGGRPRPEPEPRGLPEGIGAFFGGAAAGTGSLGGLPGGVVGGGGLGPGTMPGALGREGGLGGGGGAPPAQCTAPNKALDFPTTRRAIRVPGMRVRAQPYAAGEEDVSGWKGPVSDFLAAAIDRAPDVVALAAYGAGNNTWTGWAGTPPRGNQPAVATGGMLVHSPDVRPCDVINNGASGTETAWWVYAPNTGAEHVGGAAVGFGQPSTETGGLKTGTSLQAIADGLLIRTWADGAALDANLLITTEGYLQHGMGSASVYQSPDGFSTSSIVMGDDGTLGVGVGASKVNIPGFLDPTGLGLTAQGSQPSQLDGSTFGLWVSSTGPTLYWWDGSTNTDIGAGGGGDHTVSDSATNTSTLAVTVSHDTDGVAAPGFGVHQDWALEDASGNLDTAGRVVTLWGDATHGQEDAEFQHHLMLLGTLRECSRLGGNTATGIAGGGRFYVYADGTSTAAIPDAMQYRIVDTNDGAPVDGWGGEENWVLQRATGTHTTAARVRVLWEDTSTIDSQWDVTVLSGGGALVGAQILGKSGAFRLPNGILELADQGTLGTPATGYGRLGYDVTADSLRPSWVDQFGTETPLALLTDVGGGGDHDVADAATNTVSTAVDISHTTSGTAALGFGVRQTYSLENAAGSTVEAARIDAYWATTPSAGSEDTSVSWSALLGGAMTEFMLYDAGDNLVVFTYEDTSDVVRRRIAVRHTRSSGGGAAGIGAGMTFQAEMGTGGYDDLGYLDMEATDTTSGAQDADGVFTIKVAGGDVEALRLDADGDGAGGTATAVRVTQGRFDLMEQATPGNPVANGHRIHVDDETTWARDENGERRALDNVVLADAAARSSQSSGGAGVESLKSVTLPAGYLATDGDVIRVTASGAIDAAAGNRSVVLTFGGTNVVSAVVTNTGARVWRLTCEVIRRGATSQFASSEFFEGQGSVSGAAVELLNTAPAETLSGTVAITVSGQDATSGDSVHCDMLLVEPLIRA